MKLSLSKHQERQPNLATQISLYQYPEGLKESVKHRIFELEGIPSAGSQGIQGVVLVKLGIMPKRNLIYSVSAFSFPSISFLNVSAQV